MKTLNIIARKPKNAEGAEYILVDRGAALCARLNDDGRWVVGTATPDSLACGEWFWGYYFNTYADALSYFNAQ